MFLLPGLPLGDVFLIAYLPNLSPGEALAVAYLPNLPPGHALESLICPQNEPLGQASAPQVGPRRPHGILQQKQPK